MKSVIASFLSIFVLVSTGCAQNASKLSREKAMEIIQTAMNAPKFYPSGDFGTVRISDEGLQKGLQAGYWEKNGWEYVLTAKGNAYFEMIGFPGTMGTGGQHQWWVKPLEMEKLRMKVTQVTGIQRQGTASSVNYEWQYEVKRLPKEVKDLLVDQPARESHVMMTLFDDGWRIRR